MKKQVDHFIPLIRLTYDIVYLMTWNIWDNKEDSSLVT
jgi:hypothetical protein